MEKGVHDDDGDDDNDDGGGGGDSGEEEGQETVAAGVCRVGGARSCMTDQRVDYRKGLWRGIEEFVEAAKRLRS